MILGRRPQRGLPLRLAWGLAAGAASVAPAHAHGAIAQMNAFYGGMAHPFLNLPQWLMLVALGLWLGQQRGLRLAAPMLALSACSAPALLLASGAFGLPRLPAPAPGVLTGLAMVLGALVAASIRTSGGATDALRPLAAGLAGIAIGLDSGVDGSPTAGALALFMAGAWVVITVLTANVAYYAALATGPVRVTASGPAAPGRRWVQVGMRIVGAWIFAASLMMLAFQLRGAWQT
ncbi:MAG: hypothetical protein JWQ88_3358 [Rhodoferax sp.]|nr:hypothetical protein [Rhodoferax sp.]